MTLQLQAVLQYLGEYVALLFNLVLFPTWAVGMETKMMCLLLHHSLWSNGPDHLSQPPIEPSFVSLSMEQHVRPKLQAMRTHPLTTEHRQMSPVWGAADLITAGNLHTQEI